MSSPTPLVVIVDDDDDLRENFIDILKSRGYLCHGFGNAESAIAALSEGTCSPEIVVMDGDLPGMPGRDAIAEIIRTHPDLSILAISGEAHRSEGMLGSGAKVFLKKPIEVSTFLETIAQLVTR
ncbi:MAG: response regulator [Verrucomicrobiaceae bacterium]|nr:response regulator [Verrucomicrobiaceae bacterium]NCF92091.1 response regulator [Verrucomicrobiaceae bacterium]